jgi:aspartate--ammonia ligase
MPNHIFPRAYQPVLSLRETERAIRLIKEFFQTNLAVALNLTRVTAPLFVHSGTGINDDLNGVERPVAFPVRDLRGARVEIVHSLAKWKRLMLADYGFGHGEGLYTDMNAIRPDEGLDNTHSLYVDQWDWERVIDPGQDRTIPFLKETVRALWATFVEADAALRKEFKPVAEKVAPIPRELVFLHAEEILARYPTLPRKERETRIVQEIPGVFIIGIGATLKDGYPHEMRAADYDDWCTPTVKGPDGEQYHGLNGDILMWNPVTKRRHELSSMGIRVTRETLVQQLKETNQEHFLNLPYHKMILANEIPQSIGGGIGQSRTYQYLLGKAALGECSVTIWPHQLHEACAAKGIHLLR